MLLQLEGAISAGHFTTGLGLGNGASAAGPSELHVPDLAHKLHRHAADTQQFQRLLHGHGTHKLTGIRGCFDSKQWGSRIQGPGTSTNAAR